PPVTFIDTPSLVGGAGLDQQPVADHGVRGVMIAAAVGLGATQVDAFIPVDTVPRAVEHEMAGLVVVTAAAPMQEVEITDLARHLWIADRLGEACRSHIGPGTSLVAADDVRDVVLVDSRRLPADVGIRIN